MPVVTSIYAALAIVLLLSLAYRVVQVRRSEKIGLGEGGSTQLQRRIRAHGNAVENIPIALIGLLLLELGGMQAWVLHLLGAVLIVSRVLHAIGVSSRSGVSFGRFWGMLGTWLVLLAMAVLLLLQAFSLLR
jgi:uncharacterized protein